MQFEGLCARETLDGRHNLCGDGFCRATQKRRAPLGSPAMNPGSRMELVILSVSTNYRSPPSGVAGWPCSV